ncbi:MULTISPECIES: Na(+)-translocating NADH-quinone reductase subunit C [unclassified Methylophaga]|uniref:Na(+)-translocating NADH-quinone reductase subunit C n=1 Tax=unclassified Methylophaga TaxID=2629249 RepID=UPI000C8BBD56|nr:MULTISPECIES: Na(+)-translocating NADH-quinone reductase subunit C [unclassified Methylophaga]MBN46687.1 Na(+)-translocating NADH-quinone reductase subunit C [Methylophaga sp.]|tara:strand:+ start:27889 stop:28716 length:828 start_codon:yes stop_codon:yes gene_type:complete
MAEITRKKGFFGQLMQRPNDDPTKTIFIAIMLCLVCSVMVSTAAVALKSKQVVNKKNDIRQNILAVTGQYEPGMDMEVAFEQFEVRLVDLASGEFAENDIDPTTYDQRKASGSPDLGVRLGNREDIAGIGSRAKYAPVYILRQGDEIEQLVIPVHGYGLWSTMYGFLSLESDFNTIRGLRFYEHAETPGLGGEIENPRWLAKWEGKKIFDANGNVEFRVVRGYVDNNTPQAEYKVDGLSGATLTSQGVSNMMVFWLGENGFGPFLQNMRSDMGNN